MSAPVDVLAVMERAVMPLPGTRAELREARAAVAQLIHYSHKVEQRRRGVLHGDADAEAQDWAEFRAALARVEGGAE